VNHPDAFEVGTTRPDVGVPDSGQPAAAPGDTVQAASRRTRIARTRDGLLTAGRWCAVASLFFASVNKPGTNIAVFLSLVFSLLGSGFSERWSSAFRHPVARGFLVWCGVLVLSALHTWYLTSRLPLRGTFVWVCLYPLVMGTLLQTRTWRRRALAAFAIAVLLTLILSYAMAIGLIPQRPRVQQNPFMADTVFKEYTQQGLALLIYLSMALAASLETRSSRKRLLLLASVVLGLVNIVFMIESRTTYLTLIPLAAFWTWWLLMRRRTRWRSVLLVSSLGIVTLTGILLTPVVRTRLVDDMASETALYLNHHVATSTGIRLELWRKTIPIVESAPWFGHGLHQWAPLYRKSIEGTPDMHGFLMGHPHQEMLLILAEQGAVGLLIYLILVIALARYIQRLEPPEQGLYASILLIYLVAGLANGLWADFTHRNVFVLLLACIPMASARTRPDTPLPGTGR